MVAKITSVVEGEQELTLDVRKIIAGMPAELQAANERIGPRALGRAQPTPLAVGFGEGATPRVVATGRELRLEAGGPWRAGHVPEAGWGAESAPRDGERPYLLAALEAEMPRVEADYAEAVRRAALKVGWPMTQIRIT